MKTLIDSIFDLIYPPVEECPLCGSEYEGEYCPKCLKELKGAQLPSCSVCGRFLDCRLGEEANTCLFCLAEKPIFDLARSAGPYEGLLKEAIYLFKYTGRRSLSGLLAMLLIERIVTDKGFLPVDLVIPVPVHREKLLERTFNQSELLAGEVGKSLSIPVDSLSLVRTRNTSSLSKLNARQRRETLRDAFAVRDPKNIVGKNILLVDDIITTGNTVGECSRTLRNAGAAGVYVVALAAGKVRG